MPEDVEVSGCLDYFAFAVLIRRLVLQPLHGGSKVLVEKPYPFAILRIDFVRRYKKSDF